MKTTGQLSLGMAIHNSAVRLWLSDDEKRRNGEDSNDRKAARRSAVPIGPGNTRKTPAT